MTSLASAATRRLFFSLRPSPFSLPLSNSSLLAFLAQNDWYITWTQISKRGLKNADNVKREGMNGTQGQREARVGERRVRHSEQPARGEPLVISPTVGIHSRDKKLAPEDTFGEVEGLDCA
ncbi:hypothetical protein PM082_012179 [Marasmius tenuissimus]|nr:hypothetical protein PM082_012179 [Marasmius tenuissimus]